MGTRQDQYIGLNERAKKWLEENALKCRYVHTTLLIHADRTEEKLPVEVVDAFEETEFDHIVGAWTDHVESLMEYKLKGGQVAREFVQASPWSSGPMYFVALQATNNGEWEVVKESLWHKDDSESEGQLGTLDEEYGRLTESDTAGIN